MKSSIIILFTGVIVWECACKRLYYDDMNSVDNLQNWQLSSSGNITIYDGYINGKEHDLCPQNYDDPCLDMKGKGVETWIEREFAVNKAQSLMLKYDLRVSLCDWEDKLYIQYICGTSHNYTTDYNTIKVYGYSETNDWDKTINLPSSCNSVDNVKIRFLLYSSPLDTAWSCSNTWGVYLDDIFLCDEQNCDRVTKYDIFTTEKNTYTNNNNNDNNGYNGDDDTNYKHTTYHSNSSNNDDSDSSDSVLIILLVLGGCICSIPGAIFAYKHDKKRRLARINAMHIIVTEKPRPRPVLTKTIIIKQKPRPRPPAGVMLIQSVKHIHHYPEQDRDTIEEKTQKEGQTDV